MDENRKFITVSGILLIVAGMVCILRPDFAIKSIGFIMGLLLIVSGIGGVIFSLRTQSELTNSASRLLSSVLITMFGVFLVCNRMFVGKSITFIIALWVLLEGVVMAISGWRSKSSGSSYWWAGTVTGGIAAIIGLVGVISPGLVSRLLVIFAGLALVMNGIPYLALSRKIRKETSGEITDAEEI